MYGKRYIKNNGTDRHYPYINGDNGHNDDGGSKCFAIYSGEKPPERIEVELDKTSGIFTDSHTCEGCGDQIDDDEETGYEVHGNWYCSSCFSETFATCDGCGNYIDRDEALRFEDDEYNEYCERCYSNRLAFTCYHCGNDYSDTSDMVEDQEGDTFCDDCAERHLQYCDEHDIWHSYGRGYRDSIRPGCEECEAEEEEQQRIEAEQAALEAEQSAQLALFVIEDENEER